MGVDHKQPMAPRSFIWDSLVFHTIMEQVWTLDNVNRQSHQQISNVMFIGDTNMLVSKNANICITP